MPTILRIALASAAVLVVVIGGTVFFGGSPTPPLPAPIAMPTASPAASPTVPPSPSGPARSTVWVPLSSDRYDLGISYPADWSVQASTRDWTFDADAKDWLSSAQEAFLAPDGHVRLSAWSVPLDPGTTLDTAADFEAWIQAYCQKSGNTACASIHDRAVPLCLERRDCHPGLLVPFEDDVQAFFSGGIYPADKMIVVAIWRGESDPTVVPYGGSRHILEAFLSTMGVWPEAVPFEQRQQRPVPVPSPS